MAHCTSHVQVNLAITSTNMSGLPGSPPDLCKKYKAPLFGSFELEEKSIFRSTATIFRSNTVPLELMVLTFRFGQVYSGYTGRTCILDLQKMREDLGERDCVFGEVCSSYIGQTHRKCVKICGRETVGIACGIRQRCNTGSKEAAMSATDRPWQKYYHHKSACSVSYIQSF